ncbi:TPA: super-infection exclusion protein B [Clostridium botulinum]
MQKVIDIITKMIKSSKIVAIIILLFTSICIFSSNNFLSKLGIEIFVVNNKAYIGIALILSFLYVLVEIFLQIYKVIKNKIGQHGNLRFMRKQLYDLTNDEKRILARYIVNETKTQKLSYANGVVRGLESFKIIFRSSNVGTYGMLFSYNIQPWAWEWLNKHPELLEPELSSLTNKNIDTVSYF